jgi:hypothetical protein
MLVIGFNIALAHGEKIAKLYMDAWSEINKAKYYSLQNKYNKCKEHYLKAAELHKQQRNGIICITTICLGQN